MLVYIYKYAHKHIYICTVKVSFVDRFSSEMKFFFCVPRAWRENLSKSHFTCTQTDRKKVLEERETTPVLFVVSYNKKKECKKPTAEKWESCCVHIQRQSKRVIFFSFVTFFFNFSRWIHYDTQEGQSDIVYYGEKSSFSSEMTIVQRKLWEKSYVTQKKRRKKRRRWLGKSDCIRGKVSSRKNLKLQI